MGYLLTRCRQHSSVCPWFYASLSRARTVSMDLIEPLSTVVVDVVDQLYRVGIVGGWDIWPTGRMSGTKPPPPVMWAYKT
jgi:hypothetical protein